MSHTVLDSIALGYQPVWNPARQLAAVRLRVHTIHPESVDAQHLLQLLGNDWPAAAPVLILSVESPALLQQALLCPPVHNTWLEVPATLFETPESLARLAVAQRNGHQLLRHAGPSATCSAFNAPLDARSLLSLNPEDTLKALRAHAQQASGNPFAAPMPAALCAGQIYEGIADRHLAALCLDQAGAWGLLGWPDEDVLFTHRKQPLACDTRVIEQIFQAIDEESSLEHLERLVRQDPVLVYRLLLLVNSAAFGLRHEIGSLRHALMMLGFTALGRWLRDQLPGSDNNPELHPVRYAMVMRSRLAQHLLEPGSEDNLRAEVYTTALFAQLDRLMQKPLGELLGKLPLSDRVLDAVMRQDGPYFPLLDVAQAQGNPHKLRQLPTICERHEMSLEHANRALIRMLATSRDHAGKRSQRLL